MLVNAAAREKREFRSLASLFLSLFNTQIKKPISLERYIGADDGEKGFADMSPAEKEKALEQFRRKCKRQRNKRKGAEKPLRRYTAAEIESGADLR
jgi:hypothetical protein